jgi:hypothetical protein
MTDTELRLIAAPAIIGLRSQPKKEENFVAFQSMVTRDDIGQDFFVSVADVWRRIGVIDRRGNEKLLRHGRGNQ